MIKKEGKCKNICLVNKKYTCCLTCNDKEVCAHRCNYSMGHTSISSCKNYIIEEMLSENLSINKLRGEVLIKSKELIKDRKVFIVPIKSHYCENNTFNIKYKCPICEAIGNSHIVAKYSSNCNLCGINFYWENDIK